MLATPKVRNTDPGPSNPSSAPASNGPTNHATPSTVLEAALPAVNWEGVSAISGMIAL